LPVHPHTTLIHGGFTDAFCDRNVLMAKFYCDPAQA
jgi:hypothetical protein